MNDLYRINYSGDFKLNRYTEMLIENGQLVPVVLDPVTQWCFAHDNNVYLNLDNGLLTCSRYLRSPCDIWDAAVIRIGDADEQ